MIKFSDENTIAQLCLKELPVQVLIFFFFLTSVKSVTSFINYDLVACLLFVLCALNKLLFRSPDYIVKNLYYIST